MKPLAIVPFFVFLGLTPLTSAQLEQPPSQADRDKMVQVNGFDVKGTRLPVDSIVRLSGLKVGQQVNYDIINEGCRKITATGLIKVIDYAYDVAPGKPGIVLSFHIEDEQPLYPAKIVPAEDTEKIWSCLQGADPIFSRELPNTKNAIDFYRRNIEQCIESHGQHDAYVATSVACDTQGKAQSIVFDIKPKQSAPAQK